MTEKSTTVRSAQFRGTSIIIAVAAAVVLLVGCARQRKGAAYGHEKLFQEQLAESVPVKDWGYRIQEVRFSEDYRKALVTLTAPGKTNSIKDLVLEEDDFRRYHGTLFNVDKLTADSVRNIESLTAAVTVTLPGK